MKPILDLLDLMPGWLYALIVAGCLAWGGAQTWRVHSLKSDVAAIKQAQAEAVAAAEKAAREESDRLQGVKDAAIAEAERRAKANASAAASAKSELGKLQDAIAKSNSAGDDSCKAAANRAATAGELLGACSQRYTDVAEKADRHVNDLRTFYDAWPANADFQKRLDAFTQQLKGNRP